MNTRKLFASIALAAVAATTGTAALAQEATSDAWMAAASTKSRADVQRELAQARADGSIAFSRAGYIESLKTSKSRADVAAETAAARRSGELDAINAEVYAHQPAARAVLVAGAAR